jgi:hypothetical protein
VPLLGNIFNINTKNTGFTLQKLAEQYGEIFQVKVLGHTIVFVASAALAAELGDQKRFRKYVGGPIVEIRWQCTTLSSRRSTTSQAGASPLRSGDNLLELRSYVGAAID